MTKAADLHDSQEGSRPPGDKPFELFLPPKKYRAGFYSTGRGQHRRRLVQMMSPISYRRTRVITLSLRARPQSAALRQFTPTNSPRFSQSRMRGISGSGSR